MVVDGLSECVVADRKIILPVMAGLEWFAHLTVIRWRWSSGAGDSDLMVVDWWPLLCWVVASGGERPSSARLPLLGPPLALCPCPPRSLNFIPSLSAYCFLFVCLGAEYLPCFLVLQVAALVGLGEPPAQWYVGGIQSRRWVRKRLSLHCRHRPPAPAAAAAPLLAQMGDVVKDLTAGTVGGAANLFVGHPFDTIKVKLQSQPTPAPGQLPKYAGAIDAVKQTIAAEGPRGLYKGMGAPLATVAAFNALLFTVRGQMEAVLRSEPGAPLTVGQQVVAGAGAGVAVSFLACPTELIKCRLQAQSSLAEAAAASGVAVPKGPIDVAKHVVRDAGARGLFKGLVPTLGREVPGNAVMFGVYEAAKQYLAGGPDTSGLGRGSQVLAGGLAGAALWLSVYPTDVVKSVIQVDDYRNPRYAGSLDALRKIVAADGVKGLYKGFGPAMARSVPANAATFVAYEITRSALG
ncbi:mitochondrial carnitine/acylcarnitine carrier-like protein isoform X2 [Panicum virgatum]|uniref:mitochondrial carnitine/acylcarnitine carrier-like protein isoform X2 n=1 Tax=Panicum virgatum TaxID=38727 RepID=UPI0019D63FF7|nr:mitochondrial carnitine/acylcarnitine carrier-like protein isoform X2 [Panicum virgatum]